MKNQKIIILTSSLLGLLLCLFIFTNAKVLEIEPLYEVHYIDGSGVPLSEYLPGVSANNNNHNFKVIPSIQLAHSIVIPAGHVAYIDQSITVDTLTINGQLHCDQTMADENIKITAKTIYVNGVFQCGRQNHPYTKNLDISLAHSNLDPKTNPGYRGLVVNSGGKIIITGSKRNSKWMRINQTIQPGQNYFILEKSVQTATNNWAVGDRVVVAPTSFDSTEAEAFHITFISGNTVYVDGTFQYPHWGETQPLSTLHSQRNLLDQRAEVANLTRNIMIRADEALTGPIPTNSLPGSELGGHVMVMPGGQAYIDSAEFYKMGQAGVMARYPFHWHIVGNANGQFIRNSSIHDSFQRCITVHRTSYATVHNNSCYNFKGHGFFLEDGNEIGNNITNNLGIMARAPYDNKVLLQSDRVATSESQGRFPSVSVFWISNPDNTVTHNVAAGSVGTGIWMAFENEVKDFQGNVIARPIITNTKAFNYNIAHSSIVGITWDGAPTGALANNPNNPQDRFLDSAYYKPTSVPVFSHNTFYKNKHTGLYFRGYTAVFEQNLSADNGWHYWTAFNQIFKNSVVVGRSQNFTSRDHQLRLINGRAARQMMKGIAQYDGPFEFDGIDFLHFDTAKQYYNSLDVTTVPFGVQGGTERVSNITRRLRFYPEPLHRAHLDHESSTAALGLSGSTQIRDIDGTLTGFRNGRMIGKTSLGELPTDNCIDGGEKYFTHKICPAGSSESFVQIFNGQTWAMPFVVRRSDGKLSEPMSIWNHVLGINTSIKGGTKFAVSSNTDFSYEILMKPMYNPHFWINTEKSGIKSPIITLKGYGKNCSLNGANAVSSVLALKNALTTSYYSTPTDIHFKFVTHKLYPFITPEAPMRTSDAQSTDWYVLSCQGDVEGPIIGEVTDYILQSNGLVVKGWTCRYGKTDQGSVNIEVRQNLQKTTLATVSANLTPDPEINFKCAAPSTSGYKFEYLIPARTLNLHRGKYVHVMGRHLSTSTTAQLENSGYLIPKAIINHQIEFETSTQVKQ